MNAPSSEVVRFLTDKYVNKKWIDKKMKRDPMILFEERPKKFAKWHKNMITGKGARDDSEEEEKKPKKSTKTKTSKPLKAPTTNQDIPPAT
jgi:hypothetical protein